MLGLCEESTLRDRTGAYYRKSSQYRNEKYNLGGMHSWESTAIRKYFVPGSKILVAGAGGGREAFSLAKLGFKVTAFDCNPELVSYAMQLATRSRLDINILESEADSVPSLSGTWDGAVVGWGAYTHIIGVDARIQFLKQLSQFLEPGSPILLSFLTRAESAILFHLVYTIARLFGFLRGSKQRVELGDILDGSFDHYFVRDELVDELVQAGMQLEFFALSPYGHAVARTC